MVPPGLSWPLASAASIMERAGRSLSEPDGLALSSLRNSRQGPRSRRVTSTKGVSPIKSRTVDMSAYSMPCSLFEPLNERPIDRLRSLQRGEMPAVRHGHEARARNTGGDLLREHRRGRLVAIADENKRGAADRRKQRARIGAIHDRVLLMHERLRPGFLRHGTHDSPQRFVAMSIAMHKHGELQIGHLAESPALSKRD